MTPPLLDTHAWIWWVQANPRLATKTRRALDSMPADQRPFISAISLWEVATLYSLRRIEIDTTFAAWLDRAASPRTVQIAGITPAIASEMAALPATFHRDPADRAIVATSRVMGLAVVTLDRAITDSGLVRLWRPGR